MNNTFRRLFIYETKLSLLYIGLFFSSVYLFSSKCTSNSMSSVFILFYRHFRVYFSDDSVYFNLTAHFDFSPCFLSALNIFYFNRCCYDLFAFSFGSRWPSFTTQDVHIDLGVFFLYFSILSNILIVLNRHFIAKWLCTLLFSAQTLLSLTAHEFKIHLKINYSAHNFLPLFIIITVGPMKTITSFLFLLWIFKLFFIIRAQVIGIFRQKLVRAALTVSFLSQ